MSIESEDINKPVEYSIEKEGNSTLPNEGMISRYVQTQEVDIDKLLPSQLDTGLKLEERQETTRSQLATFLIKILAGTLSASFGLIILLTVMTGFVDDSKTEALEKNSTFVKDLVTFILTAQTGLIGTALGFYFGSRGSNAD